MPVKLEPLPPQEAIQFFERLGLVLTERWDELWAAQHARAFTVAGIMRLEILTDIYELIKKALQKGTALQQFKKDFKNIMRRRGWHDERFKRPWRIETIFRTNIQSAYQAGRYKQQKELAKARPYWMYDAVNDSRTRPSHLAMDGRIYRADHPVWNTWYPPNGFNCRCRVISLSERQMKKRGLKTEKRPPSEVPDPGFQYNPGKEAFKPDIEAYRRRYKEIFGHLPAFVAEALDEIASLAKPQE